MVKKREKDKVKKKEARFKLSDITNVLQRTSPPHKVTKPKPDNSSDELSRKEKHLLKLLADVATGMWRIRRKFSAIGTDQLPDEMKKAHRYVQSTWDALTTNKLEIRDHTNEKFPQGSPALNVVAFQPTPSVQSEVITETIKPTIYYDGRLIQMGQVIVATPELAQSDKNLANNSSDSHISSNKSNHELTPDSSNESAKTDNIKDIYNNKGRGAK